MLPKRSILKSRISPHKTPQHHSILYMSAPSPNERTSPNLRSPLSNSNSLPLLLISNRISRTKSSKLSLKTVTVCPCLIKFSNEGTAFVLSSAGKVMHLLYPRALLSLPQVSDGYPRSFR